MGDPAFVPGAGESEEEACFSTISDFCWGMNHLEKRSGWLWIRSDIALGRGGDPDKG
jgi:hypothetical protein